MPKQLAPYGIASLGNQSCVALQSADAQHVGDGARHVNATQIQPSAQARGYAKAVLAELRRQIVRVVQDVVITANGEETAFETRPRHASGNLAEIGVAGGATERRSICHSPERSRRQREQYNGRGGAFRSSHVRAITLVEAEDSATAGVGHTRIRAARLSERLATVRRLTHDAIGSSFCPPRSALLASATHVAASARPR